jgi:peptidoglycan-N-acetylglucosamine deacetylase
VTRRLAAGHEVGNHSWSHADLTKLSATALQDQFTWTDLVLKRTTGRVPTLT